MSEQSSYPITTATEELRENGVYVSNTIGYSMRPMLSHHRDVVTIAAPDREPRRYDVILYRGCGDSFILHRIVAVKDDYYVVRGDNTFVDEHVPRSEVVGILVAFNRAGKRHSIDDFSYKLYSRTWCAIYPLRALWRKLRIGLSSLRRRIFGEKGKK